MKRVPCLLLIAGLALSPVLAQAKNTNDDRFDLFSHKKTGLTCDSKNCWDSHAKSKFAHDKNKYLKDKLKNKHKDKKHKKDKPGKPPVQAVPEVNAGGATLGLTLAGMLLMMMRERRRRVTA